MTDAKYIINKLLDISEIALYNNDREAYQACMKLIAEVAYEEAIRNLYYAQEVVTV